jgi:hypothetical protein
VKKHTKQSKIMVAVFNQLLSRVGWGVGKPIKNNRLRQFLIDITLGKVFPTAAQAFFRHVGRNEKRSSVWQPKSQKNDVKPYQQSSGSVLGPLQVVWRLCVA